MRYGGRRTNNITLTGSDVNVVGNIGDIDTVVDVEDESIEISYPVLMRVSGEYGLMHSTEVGISRVLFGYVINAHQHVLHQREDYYYGFFFFRGGAIWG